jgi:putative glutamine amidotransferase
VSLTPIVALTATTKEIGGLMRVRLNEAYVEAAREAGLIPLVLPPLDPAEVAPVLDAVSGLILTGGEDVDPAEYGAPRGDKTESIHTRRDKCEIAALQLARERRIPTLAICRGIQLANVALGGTLVQDIPTERPSDVEHDLSRERASRVHEVGVDEGSKLAKVLGDTTITVNSSHHQALDRVAPGLRVTARSPDGIIEGVEWTGDDWWMLGVQWHPEELTRDGKPWDRRLFAAFAAALGR